MENYAELMFHDAVAELQKADGSFAQFQKMYPHRTQSEIGPQEKAFIETRESLYIASTSPDGWPYVQHRGGPMGFMQVIGPTKLACADYRGNRQFISMGNLQQNSKISIFCMDYLNQGRLKMQGRANLRPISEVSQNLQDRLDMKDMPAERVLEIDIIALDWNCPKYIPRLYSEDALRQVIGPQIAQLQAENRALKDQLAARASGETPSHPK